jgi:hypothetical protein
MGTIGNKKNMTKEEKNRAAVMEQAHYAFLQTLPGSSVVQEEGVYPDHVTAIIADRERTETEDQGVEAAENMRMDRDAPRGAVAISDPPKKEAK